VPLLQQHVRDVAAVGVDDQSFDLADVAVGGVNVLAALHLHLARRDRVGGFQVAFRAAVAEMRPGDNVGLAVVRGIRDAGDELPLRGGIEAVELRRGTTQPDLVQGGTDQFEGNELGGLVLSAWFHDEMCDQFGDRIKVFHIYVFYARKAFAEKSPDGVRAFLAAWFETIGYMREHRAETIDIVRRTAEVSPGIARRDYDELMGMFNLTGKFDPKALDVLARSFVELGALSQSPDMRTLITEQYLPGTK